MTNETLKQIVSLNRINEKDLEEAVHFYIREWALERICLYSKKKKENFVEIKRIFQRYPRGQELKAAAAILNHVCNCKLPDEDLSWLATCIKAHLCKSDQRKIFTKNDKKPYYEKQNHKCAICGKDILLEEGELDHIIPFDFVGDELPDNYQLLCKDCNGLKSNHLGRSISILMLYGGSQK